MSQHLRVIERKDRPGTFQIVGTVPGFDRLRQNAKAKVGGKITHKKALELAREEAAALEIDMLRTAFHGPKSNGRADRLFAAIAEDYLEFEPRHLAQVARIDAVTNGLGRNIRASEVTQEAVDRLIKTMIKSPSPSRNTIKTMVIMPISAVLNFGAEREWCNKRSFKMRKETPAEKAAKRPKVFLPHEAQLLIEAAAPHLRPALLSMFCIGSRVSETLMLEWPKVDLRGGRCSYIQKGGRWRQGVMMPPAMVAALSNLPGLHTTGRVFRYPKGIRWLDYRVAQMYGGQIKRGFDHALAAAGLDPEHTPHDCRHSYASWHIAIWGNPVKLKHDGGWDNVGTLETYMHLVPEGHEAEILKFWGYRADDTRLAPSIRDILLNDWKQSINLDDLTYPAGMKAHSA